MEASDTAAILDCQLAPETQKNGESSSGLEEESGGKLSKPVLSCLRLVTVEPVLCLLMFSVALQTPLFTQYLWDRLSEDVGYNGSRSAGCNTSRFVDPLEKEVETLTAHWNLYINLGGVFLGLLVTPFLGSWSDQAGRRPLLIIPNIGLALETSVYLMVMYMKLPVEYFIMGRILSGISGDFYSVLAGCFAYIADTNDKKSRTFKVAILECCLGLSGMFASIIGGYWKKAQGYLNPCWLVLALRLSSLLYSYFFVRESVPRDPSARLLTTRHHKALWKLLSTGGNECQSSFHKYKLWLYMCCFSLVLAAHFGYKDILVVYELSSPLCWGPTLIGYASAALHLGYATSLMGLKIMQCWLADSWIAVAGLSSNIIGLLVFAFADTTELMFTGYGLCFLFMATTPVIRSKLSKLVAPSEQGALFACIAFLESLSFLVGTSLFNSLYPATLHFMKGFSFLFAAIMLLIPAGIICVIHHLDQRRY